MTKKLVAVVLCMGLALTGCGGGKDEPSREELNQQIATLTGTQAKYETEIKSLKELLFTYDKNLAEVADLNAVRRLPTGEKAYNGINNYIRLGEQLELSPSVALPNNTTIQLVTGVEYRPSNNWSFDLSNGTISLLHKNGMYVTLRAYNYVGQSTPYDAYDTILKPYLSGLAVTQLNNKVLFIGNQTVGAMATSQCYVVEESNGKGMYTGEVPTEGEKVAETSKNITETLQTGTISLDDLVGNGETAQAESEVQETTASATTDTEEVESKVESTESVTQEETKAKEVVTDYRYVVGVMLDGSTGIIFEAFYPQDENASIQEELLESCLNGLSIRGNQVKSQ